MLKLNVQCIDETIGVKQVRVVGSSAVHVFHSHRCGDLYLADGDDGRTGRSMYDHVTHLLYLYFI